MSGLERLSCDPAGEPVSEQRVSTDLAEAFAAGNLTLARNDREPTWDTIQALAADLIMARGELEKAREVYEAALAAKDESIAAVRLRAEAAEALLREAEKMTTATLAWLGSEFPDHPPREDLRVLESGLRHLERRTRAHLSGAPAPQPDLRAEVEAWREAYRIESGHYGAPHGDSGSSRESSRQSLRAAADAWLKKARALRDQNERIEAQKGDA